MPTSILQKNSGTSAASGNFTVSLPGATSGNSRVVIFMQGNTVITPPGGMTMRHSEVQFNGAYLFDTQGGSNSWVFSGAGAAQITWTAFEIPNGVYSTSLSSRGLSGGVTDYTLPSITPAAAAKVVVLAFVGGSDPNHDIVYGWTNGFVGEQRQELPSGDWQLQEVALVQGTTAGATAYTTQAQFYVPTTVMTAPAGIIAAYAYDDVAAANVNYTKTISDTLAISDAASAAATSGIVTNYTKTVSDNVGVRDTDLPQATDRQAAVADQVGVQDARYVTGTTIGGRLLELIEWDGTTVTVINLMES